MDRVSCAPARRSVTGSPVQFYAKVSLGRTPNPKWPPMPQSLIVPIPNMWSTKMICCGDPYKGGRDADLDPLAIKEEVASSIY